MKSTIVRAATWSVLSAALLTAWSCTPQARTTSMVPENVKIENQNPYTVLVVVTGGRDVNPAWTKKISSLAVRSTICETIEKHRIFKSAQISGTADYQLNVALIRYKRVSGFWGLGDDSAEVETQWELTNMKTGEALWDRSITTYQNEKLLGTFSHSERKLAANEGAMRANIAEAVESLAQVQLK